MTCGIYQVVNTINGHIYIGSSSDIDSRRLKHLSEFRRNCHSNSYFQRAWNKYGEDVFEFEVLITCPQDLLLYYEQQFIDLGKPEYNICTNAEHSTLGTTRTDEQRLNISKSKIGNKYALGCHRSDEFKKNVGDVHRGMKHTEEAREKIRIQRSIQVFTDEARLNMSIAQKARRNRERLNARND